MIESKWFRIMNNTILYLYEFDPQDFVLQDNIAGYYVAKITQYSKGKYILTDLSGELLKRNVEIRIVDNLWNIVDAIKISTLDCFLCRMANALPRP